MSSEKLKAMHEQIEKIHKVSTDQVNADMLHRFIDEQDEHLRAAEQERDQYANDLKLSQEAARRVAEYAGRLEHTVESLRAQLKAAQEQKEIWFRRVDLPGYPDGTYLIGSYKGAGDVGPFYARPIPAQQSPAVAVQICDECDIAECNHVRNKTLQIITNQPPRITEQDAREIAESYWKFKQDNDGGHYIDWLREIGRALLDKLNEKGE